MPEPMFGKRAQPVEREPWALEDAAIDPASQWQARPVLAFLLRTFAFLLPIGASLGTSVLLTRLLPFPSSTTQLVLWYVAILAVTSLVLVVVERLAKKALPLAVLLRVTTVFPDHAPSRVRTALRSTDSVKDVDAMYQEALRLGHRDRARAAQVILQLATSLSYHDRQTRGHAERVRTYTDMLAQEMKLGGTARAKLGWAALLHDIGKLRIPKEVLGKAGKLDTAEWEQMRRHPRLGLELAAPLVSWLGEYAGGIADHHENFDGSGYPEGKAGEGIALAGRMIRVADTYDVMTSVRSYKKPVPPEAARRELVDGSGRFFDPDVVRSFLRIGLGRLRWTAGPLSWLAQTPILRALEVARELGTAAAAAGAATVGAAALGVNLMLPAGADAAVPPVPPVSDHVIVVEAGTTHTETIIDAALSAAGFAVVVDEPPGHGTAEAGAGGIAYTPEPGYTGPDTVGFQVVGVGRGRGRGGAPGDLGGAHRGGSRARGRLGGHLRGSGRRSRRAGQRPGGEHRGIGDGAGPRRGDAAGRRPHPLSARCRLRRHRHLPLRGRGRGPFPRVGRSDRRGHPGARSPGGPAGLGLGRRRSRPRRPGAGERR